MRWIDPTNVSIVSQAWFTGVLVAPGAICLLLALAVRVRRGGAWVVPVDPGLGRAFNPVSD
jgi:hypothetical protein